MVHSSADSSSDHAWLNLLLNKSWSEQQLKDAVAQNLDKTKSIDNPHHYTACRLVDRVTSSFTKLKR